MLPHTVWRTWLFIAYSDGRWLYCQFSLLHLYISLLEGWENALFWENVLRGPCAVDTSCFFWSVSVHYFFFQEKSCLRGADFGVTSRWSTKLKVWPCVRVIDLKSSPWSREPIGRSRPHDRSPATYDPAPGRTACMKILHQRWTLPKYEGVWICRNMGGRAGNRLHSPLRAQSAWQVQLHPCLSLA